MAVSRDSRWLATGSDDAHGTVFSRKGKRYLLSHAAHSFDAELREQIR